MAYIPSTYVITLFLYLLINHVSSEFRLDVYDTPAQTGAMVEFQCLGSIINNEISNNFFTMGGKLGWFADNEMIGNSRTIDNQYINYIVDANMVHKYNISVHVETSHGWTNTVFKFQIQDVSVADEKTYHCALLSAENDTEHESEEQFLEVHFAPNPLHPLCSADCTDSDCTDSHSVRLKCRSETASPPVQLYWMTRTDGIDVVSMNASVRESEGFTESNLAIQPLNNTEYICVSNYTGVYEPSSRQCKMHQPIISLTQSKTEFTEGDVAVFECNIAAEPKVEHEIIWEFSPAIKLKTMTTHSSDYVSRLSIINVTVEDNGSFIMCINHNKLGRNFEKRILVVRGTGGNLPSPEQQRKDDKPQRNDDKQGDDDTVKTVKKIPPKNSADCMSQSWKSCLFIIFAELLSFALLPDVIK